jgi:methylmalonyl-CoA/ethylmalonyl-CoA epimerase
MKLAQIAVNAKDVARAKAFYADVLGLPFLFEAPGLAFFDAGGVRLMITRAERPEFDHPASLLYYRVDDIDRAHEEVRGRGARFEGAPRVVHRDAEHELWLAPLRDTEGNLLALMEARPLPAA